jgi:DNA-binding response OmpR family regulator
VLERSGVRLDPARREVVRDGHPVSLTPKELGVLGVLLRAEGAVVTTETLLERVWDEHTDPFTNTVRVTVMNLRRKLGAPTLIDTVIGAGYRMG